HGVGNADVVQVGVDQKVLVAPYAPANAEHVTVVEVLQLPEVRHLAGRFEQDLVGAVADAVDHGVGRRVGRGRQQARGPGDPIVEVEGHGPHFAFDGVPAAVHGARPGDVVVLAGVHLHALQGLV